MTRRGAPLLAQAILIALAVWPLCLAATPPADILAIGLSRYLGSPAELVRPAGTLWQGHAAAVRVRAPEGELEVNDVRWRARLADWRRAQARIELTLAGERFTLLARPGEVRMDEAERQALARLATRLARAKRQQR